jgi:hypothetical protein
MNPFDYDPFDRDKDFGYAKPMPGPNHPSLDAIKAQAALSIRLLREAGFEYNEWQVIRSLVAQMPPQHFNEPRMDDQ